MFGKEGVWDLLPPPPRNGVIDPTFFPMKEWSTKGEGGRLLLPPPPNPSLSHTSLGAGQGRRHPKGVRAVRSNGSHASQFLPLLTTIAVSNRITSLGNYFPNIMFHAIMSTFRGDIVVFSVRGFANKVKRRRRVFAYAYFCGSNFDQWRSYFASYYAKGDGG